MMIKVSIAIGLGVVAFLVLFCVGWGVCKLRHRMKTGQISATPEEILVENRIGLNKDVVQTFPIIRTCDLKIDTNSNSKLHCPICWLEFRDTDTMRQLPHCNHFFHRHCIDPVLEKQIICPVCGVVLIDSPKAPEELNGRHAHHHQIDISLRSLYSKGSSMPSSPKSFTGGTPSWVLVNRPVPLPPTALVNSSSSSERFEIELNPSDSLGASGESPLLKYLNVSHAEEWNNVDLDQKTIDISFTFGTDIPVEKRQPTSHSSANDRGVDSFTFSTDALTFTGNGGGKEPFSDAAPPTNFTSTLRRSRGKDSSSSFSDFNPSTRYSRSTSRSSRSTNSFSDSSFKQFASWDSGHPHLQEVSEYGGRDHLPLTNPPDQCSFDVLPVITGSGSFTWRPPQPSKDLPRVGSKRSTYTQL